MFVSNMRTNQCVYELHSCPIGYLQEYEKAMVKIERLEKSSAGTTKVDSVGCIQISINV